MASDQSQGEIAAGGSAYRRVPWRLTDVAIGIGVILLFQAVALLAQAGVGPVNGRLYWSVYFGPMLAWTSIYPLWVAHRRSSLPLLRVPGPGRFLKEIFLAVFLTFVMTMSLGMLLLLLRDFVGPQPTVREQFLRAGGVSNRAILTYAITGATIGPATEELFFRAFVYNALRRRLGTFVALMLQAALFALVHPYTLAQRGAIFFIGLVLAGVYDWRKTILTPILMHCFFDALVFTVALHAVWNAPFLGLTGIRHDQGCQVSSILPDSPAEKAGLRVKDVITKFDGRDVQSFDELAKLVAQRKVGDAVNVTILRDGREISIRAMLDKRSSQ
ncbi:MAG TPA: CPBP family glutamic-type intramembrane protease [Planctomycetaceae bacterium]|nr:CPBP family glutamic-type intramembrane protease [Planctomycetaceae bacterium]